jgi:hypothetical protein
LELVPLSLPKPIPTPRIDIRDAHKGRKAFVKDGGADAMQ